MGIVRSTYWAAALPTPSPIDEMQHFDYVRSIARGEGVPTVGHDLLADEVLVVGKQSPTLWFRSYPYPDDKSAEAWAGVRPQYEGIQGPTYYALMSPFYWMGRPWGPLGSFYLVRVGSGILGALSIPLAWLLGRRLMPDRPSLWLGPPLVVASINSFSAGAATIGNDVIVLTGTALAGLLILDALERRSIRRASLAGLVAGLVLLGKTTGLALVPVLGLLVAPPLWRWLRSSPARCLRWVVAFAVAFALPMVIWTAWNLATYGAISGAAEAEKITGSLQTSFAPSLDTLRLHWEGMRRGFWVGQLNDVVPSYSRWWQLIAVASVLLGLLLALVRRRPEWWPIAWGSASYPLTFAAVAGFFLLAFDRSGVILGRYGWVALVPLALAVGVAITSLGGVRAGTSLCLCVCTFMLGQEAVLAHRFLHIAYEAPTAAVDLAPAVEQSWNDGYAAADAIAIDVPCSSRHLELGLEKAPDTVRVETADGSTTGRLESATTAEFARYVLDEPVTGAVVVPVETGVAISASEREPAGSLVGGTGDPMIRVLCRFDDPRAVRFELKYSTGHPPMSRWMLYWLPVAWPILAGGASVLALLTALSRPKAAAPSSDGEDPDPIGR